MTIRTLELIDLGAVARVHTTAFPHAAISCLGLEATRRYYECLMLGPPGTRGLGLFEHHELAGYCFVGIRHRAEDAYLKRHAAFLAWRVAARPWLLATPFFRGRLRSGLRILWERIARSIDPVQAPVAVPAQNGPHSSFGIQYLMVDPRYQGRGFGKLLLSAGEEIARGCGYREIDLSVFEDNQKAIGLYERMGWRKRRDSGEWHGLMTKCLAADEPTIVTPRPLAASGTPALFATVRNVPRYTACEADAKRPASD